jgi:prevent-host-death family protein
MPEGGVRAVLWQVQEAKQRFSELIRFTESDGPQVITRHGRQIAVVISIGEYRHLRGETVEFKDYLRSGPDFADLDLSRPADGPHEIDWAGRA